MYKHGKEIFCVRADQLSIRLMSAPRLEIDSCPLLIPVRAGTHELSLSSKRLLVMEPPYVTP